MILPNLFDNKKKTDIPLIFKGNKFIPHNDKPLWISIIGPSGAGKDTLTEKLLITNNFSYVRTATSREKRDDESVDAYIWMRSRLIGEPLFPYLRSMVKEYNLFEYNYHYGNLYGTPLDSIKNAVKTNKIILYRSDSQGAQYMESKLGELFRLITINIIPDPLNEMESRILSGQRDNVSARLAESIGKLETAMDDSHFILKNPSTPIDYGKSGIESASASLKLLIASLEK